MAKVPERNVAKSTRHGQPKKLVDVDRTDRRRPDWLKAGVLRLRMTRVMRFDAFWKQTFPAALAAACQGCAAPFCFHAGTKTMLTFACSLGWLVSAFHKTENRLGAI
jgi:hypothetical protein